MEGYRGIIPTHSVNILCGRKPEYPVKTHDFRQSVDSLFSHKCYESVARIQPTISEGIEACSATAPQKPPKAELY